MAARIGIFRINICELYRGDRDTCMHYTNKNGKIEIIIIVKVIIIYITNRLYVESCDRGITLAFGYYFSFWKTSQLDITMEPPIGHNILKLIMMIHHHT